jgi:hypothetical protein
MSPIHDVSCFQAAREDVVGVKVGTAPGKREKAKHRHRQHLVRLHASNMPSRIAARQREDAMYLEATWQRGRSAMLTPA